MISKKANANKDLSVSKNITKSGTFANILKKDLVKKRMKTVNIFTPKITIRVFQIAFLSGVRKN